jgi:hypothetical protein
MPVNPLKCDYCPRVGENPQGRAAHMRWCQNNPNRLTQAPARRTQKTQRRQPHARSARKIAEAEQDLVAMVVLAFPHGIQTDDLALLEDDLRWVAHTSRVLGRK